MLLLHCPRPSPPHEQQRAETGGLVIHTYVTSKIDQKLDKKTTRTPACPARWLTMACKTWLVGKRRHRRTLVLSISRLLTSVERLDVVIVAEQQIPTALVDIDQGTVLSAT